MTDTKWVITFTDLVDDEASTDEVTVTQTIHVECATRAEAEALVGGIYDEFGPIDGVKGVEVPSTWECDGRDNCLVAA
jgi:hypothetical protein